MRCVADAAVSLAVSIAEATPSPERCAAAEAVSMADWAAEETPSLVRSAADAAVSCQALSDACYPEVVVQQQTVTGETCRHLCDEQCLTADRSESSAVLWPTF